MLKFAARKSLPKASASLCAANQAGLGNRIKCILSAKRLDRDARVVWYTDRIWGSTSGMGDKKIAISPYGDLFANDISISWLEENRYQSLIGWVLYVGGLSDSPVDFKYHETPSRVIDAYLPLIEELEPSAKVMKIVNQYNVQDLTGIHARMYDDVPDRTLHWQPYIEQINSNKPALLCTDNRRLREHFENDKDVLLVNLKTDNLVVSDWEWALAEMILLSRTKQLLATKFSTFSECAWYFGGFKQKVTLLRHPRHNTTP